MLAAPAGAGSGAAAIAGTPLTSAAKRGAAGCGRNGFTAPAAVVGPDSAACAGGSIGGAAGGPSSTVGGGPGGVNSAGAEGGIDATPSSAAATAWTRVGAAAFSADAGRTFASGVFSDADGVQPAASAAANARIRQPWKSPSFIVFSP